jgi:general secretion pathway protein D
MIVLDVTVLRLSQDIATSKGNNFLDGEGSGKNPLTATLGNGEGKAGYTFESKNGDITKTFFRGFTLSNLSYSLKIANASNSRTEVINRPTLTTLLGVEAKFFTGNVLTVALSGGFGGSIPKLPIGTDLTITPISLNGNEVTLKCAIEGSFIDASANETAITLANGATQKYTTLGQSKVSTTVKTNFDTTVMLAGVNQRTDQGQKNGFPLLQDIPLLQYVFGNETTASQKKSVVYMITPRRYEDQKTLVNKYTTAKARNPNAQPNLSIFEKRNKDWFNAAPNMPEIFSDVNHLYYEFRTGDIGPVVHTRPTSIDELKDNILPFLYF